jgi:hypothetical protein
VDSDLAEAVEALKAIFAKRKLPCSFSKAPQALVDELRKQLRVVSRYRSFLLAANPEKVETVTPVERIRLIPAEELAKAQDLVKTPGESGSAPADWKASWVVIGESSLLGDPYHHGRRGRGRVPRGARPEGEDHRRGGAARGALDVAEPPGPFRFSPAAVSPLSF